MENKGKVMGGALMIAAALFALMFFLPAPRIIFFVIICVYAMFQGYWTSILFSMIPDTVDYGEYIADVRADGFLSAFSQFISKVGAAVGPAILVAVVGALGYVPNQEQNQAVLTMINASVSLVPAALYFILGLLSMFGYDLTNIRQRQVVLELDCRRSAAEEKQG